MRLQLLGDDGNVVGIRFAGWRWALTCIYVRRDFSINCTSLRDAEFASNERDHVLVYSLVFEVACLPGCPLYIPVVYCVSSRSHLYNLRSQKSSDTLWLSMICGCRYRLRVQPIYFSQLWNYMT